MPAETLPEPSRWQRRAATKSLWAGPAANTIPTFCRLLRCAVTRWSWLCACCSVRTLASLGLQVAEARSDETFVALCLLTVTGASLLTQKLGFSDTMGAFVAGVLLAETNYSTQACSPSPALLLTKRTGPVDDREGSAGPILQAWPVPVVFLMIRMKVSQGNLPFHGQPAVCRRKGRRLREAACRLRRTSVRSGECCSASSL